MRSRHPPSPPPAPPWHGDPALRWSALALALTLVMLVLGWCWRAIGTAPPSTERTRAAAAAVPAAAAIAKPPQTLARAAPAAAALTAALPRALPAAATLPAPGVEVCGWGPVELPDDDPFPLQRIPAAQRAAALDQAEQRLLADADPRINAAGLLIGARGRGQGARQRLEKLAWLASGSQDPVIYAFALHGCQGLAERDGSACRLLSRAQAARLEPDNAQAWLELAAEAAAQGEADAEHEAMRHAAQATRSRAHAAQLPALVHRALAPPLPALPRTLASSVALSVHDTWRLSPAATGQAREYCGAGVVPGEAEPARQVTCRALAGVLGAHGGSLAELGAALAIARAWRVDGAAAAAWQQEHDALIEAGAPGPGDQTDLACGALAAAQAWLQRVADGGERRALREHMQAHGRSLQEWSERHRRTIALASAAATEAAAADGAGDPGP
ncbi:hypothetical protein HLB44_07925 [Aquincola sp. S2]|uniref:Sel1 repeat family protein n=1 Tax=Pseudaquabacterium terrae TaxID=2732868 RepID=A0ABX2EE81_9BURK|nr:hypothetical protein [Aquabacterium terrae]NRF66907.1 hypothetical protein [Aquabacterium terrae]